MNLILHPLNFIIQKLSHEILRYLLLERKLILIYWMMKILQYLMSVIQYKIHQPVINFMWIIAINGEYTITSQVILDEIQLHQNERGKSKVNTSLCRSKIYHRKYLEDI